jgi:hypothetical protein
VDVTGARRIDEDQENGEKKVANGGGSIDVICGNRHHSSRAHATVGIHSSPYPPPP